MDIKKKVIQKLVYPLLLKFEGQSQRENYLKFLKSRESYTIVENKKIQQQRLYNIIDYSMNHIPYYINVKERINFTYSLDTIFEDIKRFPPLTKDLLRMNFNILSNTKGKKFYYNHSSGSTGEPVNFIQDTSFLSDYVTRYTNSIAGIELGDKLIRFWGSEKEIIKGNASLRNRLINKYVYRTKIFSAFKTSEQDMHGFIEEVNVFKPKAIIAFVQSIYEAAQFIERNNLSVNPPQSIVVCTGTLYDYMREKIEKVFNCNVYNLYSSREAGHMAIDCEKQEGMHLSIFNHYIEIVDEEGNEVKDGETGEVVLTLLTNFTMPLIRYKLGDFAVKTSDECSCGRGYPLIKSVVGRTANTFRNIKGEIIHGQYFTNLLFDIDFIRKFQVIQDGIENLTVKLELFNNNDFENNRDKFDDIKKNILLVMGNNCKVEFVMEDKIKPSPSGKFLFTISNL